MMQLLASIHSRGDPTLLCTPQKRKYSAVYGSTCTCEACVEVCEEYGEMSVMYCVRIFTLLCAFSYRKCSTEQYCADIHA